MKPSVLAVLLLNMLVGQAYGIVTGQALVDEARNWLGYPYIYGDPFNENWTGQQGFDGLYWYGWVFEMSLWQGGFDCSGLVSYCAGLRRHFGVSEFRDFSLFGAGRPYWKVAESGDLIPSGNWSHIRILSVNKPESLRLHFIHAPQQGIPVKEEYRTYEELNNIGAHAYLFLNDNAGPEIIVTGVEDGGKYPPPVNINYLVNDWNEPLWSVFFEGNYQKEVELTETGDYSLRVFSKDWAINESSTILNFTIEGPLQIESTDPAGEGRDDGGDGAWVATWFPYEVYLDPHGSQELTVEIQNVAQMPKTCVARTSATWESVTEGNGSVTEIAELICSRKDKPDDGDDGGDGDGPPDRDRPDDNLIVHFLSIAEGFFDPERVSH
jgi:hypothetical protein